jgi:hypothetical protein
MEAAMTRTDADPRTFDRFLYERLDALLDSRPVASIEELAHAMSLPPSRLYRAVRSPHAPAAWVCLRPLGRAKRETGNDGRPWRRVFLRSRRPEDARFAWQKRLLSAAR